MKAIWRDAVLAESDKTEVVEGNHYFPPDAINREYFSESQTHTTCPWKGEASYYDVVVNGEVNRDAAWYYPEPKPAARNIKDHIAFWRGVTVEPEPEFAVGSSAEVAAGKQRNNRSSAYLRFKRFYTSSTKIFVDNTKSFVLV